MNSRVPRSTWRGLVIVAAALVVAGCGSVRYPQNYLLDLQPPVPAPQSPGALGQLVVREFHCPGYLCDGRIVYRQTANEVGFYEYHRWAMSPRQMITDSIAASVRAKGLFTAVSVGEVDTGTALLLKGAVERLEEVDRGPDVHAVCALSAQLSDARTKAVIWTYSDSATVPVTERNVAGVVRSLTAATRQAVDALVASMEQQLLSAARRPSPQLAPRDEEGQAASAARR